MMRELDLHALLAPGRQIVEAFPWDSAPQNLPRDRGGKHGPTSGAAGGSHRHGGGEGPPSRRDGRSGHHETYSKSSFTELQVEASVPTGSI